MVREEKLSQMTILVKDKRLHFKTNLMSFFVESCMVRELKTENSYYFS